MPPAPAGPRRHLLRLDGDGPVEAILVWFEIALDEERRLSTGPAGPPTGAVAYPYYTTRGPRDFLAKCPPSIGPQ
jgi:hypothetical protein